MPETVNFTEEAEDTYTSSSIARVGWHQDPLGENGFLHVEFQSGEKYLYIDVPRDVFDEFVQRGKNPDEFEDSVGVYFHKSVRPQFQKKGSDYVEMSGSQSTATAN